MTFDWDDANVLHLARHSITPEEAEQVVTGDPVDLEIQTLDGEYRFPQVGQTPEGRLLTIISALRGNRVRVITGWDATRSERMQYLRYLVERGS